MVDLVLFVCDKGVNNSALVEQRPNETYKETSWSWWDKLGQAAGFMVTQQPSQQEQQRKQESDEDDEDDEEEVKVLLLKPEKRRHRSESEEDDDDADDDDDELPPSFHKKKMTPLRPHPPDACVAVNLATKDAASYPMTAVQGIQGKSPPSPSSTSAIGGATTSIYYYAWHKGELLRDDQICLERVVLMEMTPTPSDVGATTPKHVTDELLVRRRLQQVMNRSSSGGTTTITIAPIHQFDIPNRKQEQTTTQNDSSNPALPLTPGEAAVDNKLSLKKEELVADQTSDGTSERNVESETAPVEAISQAETREEMDEIKGESPFVSEDYC